MKLLIGSNNPDKAKEIAQLLSDLPIELVLPANLGQDIPQPEEDGKTLEENAWIKARTIYLATGLPTIADDTGLEVDALDGAPGVFSARFAGENASYSENCDRLMAELVGESDRSARFRTVICFCYDNTTFFSEGEVEGTIERERSGGGGFGYDPLFKPDGAEKTFAEMTSEEKGNISHRGKALLRLREQLEHYLGAADE